MNKLITIAALLMTLATVPAYAISYPVASGPAVSAPGDASVAVHNDIGPKGKGS
jgi:hypothetical protein